jgi:hypothetical protein
LNGTDNLFDADGKRVNDAVRALLLGFMQTFARWIATNAKG